MSIQQIQLREPGRVHAFISHMWARDTAYSQLVSLLIEVLGDSLVNLSVPTSQALTLLSTGPAALIQERELQIEHIAFCSQEIAAAEELAADLHAKLDEQKARLRQVRQALLALAEIPKVEERIRTAGGRGLGERLVRLEAMHLEDLRTLARTVDKSFNVASAERSILHLESQLQEALATVQTRSTEKQDRTTRVSLIDAVENPTDYNTFHHPDVLFRALKRSSSAARRHPGLALELYYRLRTADVVFVLAGASDVYREWMEFEKELCLDLRKPLIVVQPDPDTAAPPEVVSFSLASACQLTKEDLERRLVELLGHEADAVVCARTYTRDRTHRQG